MTFGSSMWQVRAERAEDALLEAERHDANVASDLRDFAAESIEDDPRLICSSLASFADRLSPDPGGGRR